MNQVTFDYIPDDHENVEPAKIEFEKKDTLALTVEGVISVDDLVEKTSVAAQECDKNHSESDSAELIPIKQINAMQVFSVENGLDPVIKRIKEEVEKEVLDPSDEKGRARIRSLARKVGSAKMRLKELGQGLTEDWRKKTKAVTSETSRMEKELDALRDSILKPVEEYEAKKEARKQKFEGRINDILSAAEIFEALTSDQIKQRLDKVTDLFKYDWEEFEERAKQAWFQVEPKLSRMLQERSKYEEDQAELERLRQEKLEKERIDVHEKALKRMSDMTAIDISEISAAKIAGNKSGLLAIYERDWQEFSDQAKKLLDTLVEKLDAMYAEQHKKEQDAIAEAARKEAEEKAAKEAEEAERIAKEELDRVQKEKEEAERKAAEEKDRAEKARIFGHELNIERMRRLYEISGECTSLAIYGRISELKAVYDRDWEEFADQAKSLNDTAIAYLSEQKSQAEDRERKMQIERDERTRSEAIEAERVRKQKEEDAEAERLKRESNDLHKAKINGEAANALADIMRTTYDEALLVISQIADGKIPHVKIEY